MHTIRKSLLGTLGRLLSPWSILQTLILKAIWHEHMRHMREHMTYEKHMTLQTESCFFWTLNNRWDITQVKKAVPWLVPWISLSWAIYDAVFSFLFASDDHQVVQHKRILRAWNLSLFQLKWKGRYKAMCFHVCVTSKTIHCTDTTISTSGNHK